MRKITALMLLSITVTVGVGALTPKATNAQLFYPPASDRHSLMVIGQGVVRVPADTADIELVFSSESSNDELETQPSSLPQTRGISSPSGYASGTPRANVSLEQQDPAASPTLLLNYKTAAESSPSKKPLTKATLQPVVNSLVAKGISNDKIQVQISPNSSENNAKILIRLEKPTRDRVQEIVATANKATSQLENLSVKSVGVEYAVNDCQALQSSVYQSAMKDAQSRAQALATAMSVKLDTPSVAEPFYTLFYPSCSSKTGVPLPSFASFLLSPTYNPDSPAEVEMKKDIFVTYTTK
ncbi:MULTISPECIES: SIMPL domain-containing protein [unclassified Nostoc]|uniref:SIMPL domain-containing protein n=1 Tax=unclassified Nostoc TaxID=2593658 RepID=UPI002AD54DA6|nr:MULTISPECIES: SIMPL domain-containing protein [unclassified Nostoc]MDZ7987830.1 SIMPL domain-containing protein [Nostoc sp. DedVER02]MDZ8116258.1 SIMPL domain-containing protein [Nostoc sp. DedVER01b]